MARFRAAGKRRKVARPAQRGAGALRRVAALAAGLWLLAGAAGAAAQSIVSTGGSLAEMRLLPGRMQADGTRLAGLSVTLSEGWKTYWRSPGEAGVPPALDFSASENLARAEVLWPRPILFESFGLTTVGYAGRVVLPLRLVPEDAAAPIRLALDASYGVCREVCVFEEAGIARALPPGLAEGAGEVARWLARVPPPGPEAGLERATCRIEGAGETRRFSARLAFAAPVRAPTVLLEGTDRAWFHDVETRAEGRAVHVEAALSLASAEAWLPREAVRMTLLADGLSADIRGCTGGAG
jgi:DsbC/DsbD-like thiol-disulfide interchange protein